MTRALLFVNGEISNASAVRKLIESGDKLIAVDGGLRHLESIDQIPQILIGDMDSIDPAQAARLTIHGTHVLRFDPVKDETDLELALRYAVAEHCNPIIVVGALGGRLDQTLANIALLTASEYSAKTILDDGVQRVFAVTSELVLEGKAGDLVSLIPWGTLVAGISTQGLRYALHGETLYPHGTRGISNEMLADAATIKINSGILLCVHKRKDPG